MNTAYAQATNAANQVAGDTASELAKLIEMVIAKIPLWIAAFIVIVLSVLVAKMARSIVENKMAEKGIEEEHQEVQILAGRLTYIGVLTLGITVALKIAGIDLTAILAAVAFGIGFALKDLIMNFLAGIMILVGGHFSLGDFINVGGTSGKVVEIQSRVTILQAFDGTKVIVPNGDLFKKQVVSFTGNPFRRIQMVVGVDYRHDLKNVVKICMKSIKETPGVLIEPKPAVIVDEFADSGINIVIKAWVESRGGWVKIKSELAQNIKTAFDEHGIVIPWPITNIVQDKDSTIEEKMLIEEAVIEAVEEPAAVPIATLTPEPVVQTVAEEEAQPLKPLGEQ